MDTQAEEQNTDQTKDLVQIEAMDDRPVPDNAAIIATRSNIAVEAKIEKKTSENVANKDVTVPDNDVAIKSTMLTEHILEIGAEEAQVTHQFGEQLAPTNIMLVERHIIQNVQSTGEEQTAVDLGPSVTTSEVLKVLA